MTSFHLRSSRVWSVCNFCSKVMFRSNPDRSSLGTKPGSVALEYVDTQHHEDVMLYWIIIFSVLAVFAAGLGFDTTRILATYAAMALLLIYLVRLAVTLIQRTLQS